MPQSRSELPNIVEATRSYEKWVGQHIPLVQADFDLKHVEMRDAIFPFLRATFYRWAQIWPVVCPHLADAPQVLAVGDLHVDNFGTWRDIEGRLIWGVNDFDEAFPAAYTVDLVRLATSAYVAIEDAHLTLSRKRASAAIEQGYRDSLAKGGSGFVLAEHHKWLRLLALNTLRDPAMFWEKVKSFPKFRGSLPEEVRKLLHVSIPLHETDFEMKSRIAGLGSLGHTRVLAVASWHGAHVVREAKQLTPSGFVWARHKDSGEILCKKLIDAAIRIPDPHVHFTGHWIVRRLAPDCCRIEVSALPEKRDEERLLYCMGWETANIHLGSPRAIAAVKRDLGKRKESWLHKAAKLMRRAVYADWKTWVRKYDRYPRMKQLLK